MERSFEINILVISMNEKYQLAEAEHNLILQELIRALEHEATPVEKPVAIILGGQPGCGKGGLVDLSINEFKNQNAAVINGDEYRKYHPKSREILKKHEQDYAKHTDPDVREWTKRLLDYAIDTKRNIIFEGTMRQDGPICMTLARLRSEGYVVKIRVLAVNERESLLGVYQRYEEQKAKMGFGRMSPRSSHDAAYTGMLKTIERIEQEKLFDTLQVYNRNKLLIYENKRIDHEYQRAPGVVEAIQQERNKEWSLQKNRGYLDAWDRVIKQMEQRQTGASDIDHVLKITHEFLD